MPPANLEITKTAIDDFKEIQEYMLIAREENAEKTYAKLKKKGKPEGASLLHIACALIFPA